MLPTVTHFAHLYSYVISRTDWYAALEKLYFMQNVIQMLTLTRRLIYCICTTVGIIGKIFAHLKRPKMPCIVLTGKPWNTKNEREWINELQTYSLEKSMLLCSPNSILLYNFKTSWGTLDSVSETQLVGFIPIGCQNSSTFGI